MKNQWDLEVPPPGGVMRDMGLDEVEVYIARRHNTVPQYIATRKILDPCMNMERRLGPSGKKCVGVREASTGGRRVGVGEGGG